MKKQLARKQQPSLNEKRPRRPRSASIKLPRKQSNPNASGDCFIERLKLMEQILLNKEKMLYKDIEENYIISYELYTGKCELTLTDIWNELLKYSMLNKGVK